MAFRSTRALLKAQISTMLSSGKDPRITASNIRSVLEDFVDSIRPSYDETDPNSPRFIAGTKPSGGGGVTLTKASDADVDAETDDSDYMTVAKVFRAIARKVKAATATVSGIVELATNSEVDAGTDTVRAVTPAGVRRATGAQVSGDEKTAGTETGVRRFSPKDVHDMVDSHSPDALTLSDDTPESPGTASAGTGTEASRSDHVHPSDAPAPSNANPLSPGTASQGTSSRYSRQDHIHPTQSVPQPGTATPLVEGTAIVGTSTKYSREDHVHPAPTLPYHVNSSVGSNYENIATGLTSDTILGITIRGTVSSNTIERTLIRRLGAIQDDTRIVLGLSGFNNAVLLKASGTNLQMRVPNSTVTNVSTEVVELGIGVAA